MKYRHPLRGKFQRREQNDQVSIYIFGAKKNRNQTQLFEDKRKMLGYNNKASSIQYIQEFNAEMRISFIREVFIFSEFISLQRG